MRAHLQDHTHKPGGETCRLMSFRPLAIAFAAVVLEAESVVWLFVALVCKWLSLLELS